MKEYRRGAHSVFEIHLHLVWVTKYRRKVSAGEVGLRVHPRQNRRRFPEWNRGAG